MVLYSQTNEKYQNQSHKKMRIKQESILTIVCYYHRGNRQAFSPAWRLFWISSSIAFPQQTPTLESPC